MLVKILLRDVSMKMEDFSEGVTAEDVKKHMNTGKTETGSSQRMFAYGSL